MSVPENQFPEFAGTPLSELIALKARVLDSTQYKEECLPLAEAFSRSREVAADPVATFAVQEQLFESILGFQAQKAASSGDVADTMLYSQLTTVAKGIADSIGWRTLEYKRFLPELLIAHPQTGALDPVSSRVELEEARRILETEGGFVLLNDLTNFLRYGDLTVINENGMRLQEVKQAGKLAQSSRITQQRAKLRVINEFLVGNSQTLTLDGMEHIPMFLPNFKPETYHEQLAEIIASARKDGYGRSDVAPFFSLEIFDRGIPLGAGIKPERPFSDQKDSLITFNSIMPFNNYRDLASSAPFGIFPLADADCFDLISGRLAIRNSLHIGGMRAVYAGMGINMLKAEQSLEDRKKFTKAVYDSPTGSRQQNDLTRAGFLSYKLEYGGISVIMDQHYFSKIIIDLFNPISFAAIDRVKMNQALELSQQGKFKFGSSQLSLSANETAIWR